MQQQTILCISIHQNNNSLHTGIFYLSEQKELPFLCWTPDCRWAGWTKSTTTLRRLRYSSSRRPQKCAAELESTPRREGCAREGKYRQVKYAGISTHPSGTFRFGDPGILLKRRSLKIIGSEPDMFTEFFLGDLRMCAHAQKEHDHYQLTIHTNQHLSVSMVVGKSREMRELMILWSEILNTYNLCKNKKIKNQSTIIKIEKSDTRNAK